MASSGITVTAATPDTLGSRTRAIAEATGSTWSQHRDLIDMDIAVYSPFELSSRGDMAIAAAVGAVYNAVRAFDDDPFRWAGPGTSTASELDDETVTIDAVKYVLGSVSTVVVYERPAPHERGPRSKRPCSGSSRMAGCRPWTW